MLPSKQTSRAGYFFVITSQDEAKLLVSPSTFVLLILVDVGLVVVAVAWLVW